MLDVLLVCPHYSWPKKSPPIGLAYLAAVLEKGGHSVQIIDMSALCMDYTDLKKEIEHSKPKLVGISFMTNQYEDARKVSQVAKEADQSITTIVGGPHVSALPREILAEDSVDIAVIGEGEITLLELANRLLRGKHELDTIDGVAYKKRGRIHLNQPRELIGNLDSIPFPAWHLLPVEKYAIPATGGNVCEPVFAVISSRGCPNHCIFCDSHTVFGRTFRARSAQDIFDELLYLNKRFGANQFDFVDDTMTVDKERIRRICRLMLDSNCEFKWMCNARVDTVTPDMLGLMKEAGCVRVDFGVESGNPEVLERARKGITIEQIRSAHKMARQAGLSVGSFVMVGNLGEDFSSIVQTKHLLEELDTDDILIAIATPFPGTRLYQIAKNSGWIQSHDWSKYVTSPNYVPDYQPIMRTDSMSPKEILESFFYLHSQFAGKKFRTRYGKYFFLHKRFYKEPIFNIRSGKELKHKLKLGTRLVGSYLRRY